MLAMLSGKAKTLIALLASDNDGEALNAVRALKRTLKADGMDFHDLANSVGARSFTPPPRPAPCPKCAVEREMRARKQDAEKGAHAADLAWLQAQSFAFSPREREFLDNIGEWRGELTEKQDAWFRTILAKAKRAAAAQSEGEF